MTKFADNDGKSTSYTIINENGMKSTISIKKWAADYLQESKDDVHRYIQDLYDDICKKFPYISRRKKGDTIRKIIEEYTISSGNVKNVSSLL